MDGKAAWMVSVLVGAHTALRGRKLTTSRHLSSCQIWCLGWVYGIFFGIGRAARSCIGAVMLEGKRGSLVGEKKAPRRSLFLMYKSSPKREIVWNQYQYQCL
jgi:hypothetical protein